jgi:DNA replication protein DnaC
MSIAAENIPALMRRGVPERTARASIATITTEAQVQASERTEDLTILGGEPGVGKSVAACLWLWRLCNGKPECMRWIQSGDLARGYAYDREAFEGLVGAYALVIDDLGLEHLDDKGRFLELFEEIISKRFSKMRKTLVTTNITDPALFAKRYGERIVSRIHEDGAFVVCGGRDMRRKPAA